MRVPDLSLPDPAVRRWTAYRKLAVLKAIDDGVLTLSEACRTYGLSPEELDEWRRLCSEHGSEALKTTKLMAFRAIDFVEVRRNRRRGRPTRYRRLHPG